MNAPPVRVWWSSICPQVLISGYFTVFLLFRQSSYEPLGNTTRKRVCCFICFFKQALTFWDYGDALALIKEIVIQTERSKLNEHLVYAPQPLKVCVECTWLSLRRTLLIGIKRGCMWPQAVQRLTNFLSLCDPREHIQTLSWDLHHPKDLFVI